MLPCPMFSSQSSQSPSPSPSSSLLRVLEASAFTSFPLPFHFELSTINFLSLSPFPATLTGHTELNENKTTLSLAVATLTNPVTHNPFACHSCKKHRGVGIPSECHPERSEGSAFSRPLSLPPRQSHPTKGNPSIVSALSLPLVTTHQSPITKSFTFRTYEKTACKSCRIRTSKTQDLKPFRMNTSEKTRRGSAPAPSVLFVALPAAPFPRHSSRDKRLHHGRTILPSNFQLSTLQVQSRVHWAGYSSFNFQLSSFIFRLSTLQVQSPHVIPGDR